MTMTAQHSFAQHSLINIIRTVPDFPKAGIDFYDITPLFDNGNLPILVEALLEALPSALLQEAECFIGVEARGFILASALALKTNKNLAVVRKKGKLPPPIYEYSYTTEYSQDTLQISQHVKPAKVIVVDDVLATGGTLRATIELAKKAGHSVLGSLVLMDLVDLHPPMTDVCAVIRC